MTSHRVTLDVNDKAIPIKGFVQDFIGNVVTGMVATLKGTGKTQNSLLSIEGDRVDIQVGAAAVFANPFVSEFIKNTVCGMVATLNGVEHIDRLQISIIEQDVVEENQR